MSVCRVLMWWLCATEATALPWLKAVLGKRDLLEGVHMWPWVGPDVILLTYEPHPVVDGAPTSDDTALQLDPASTHGDIHFASHGVRADQLKGGVHWAALVERVDPRGKPPTVTDCMRLHTDGGCLSQTGYGCCTPSIRQR